MDILMILYLAIIAAGLGLLFLLCVLLSKNKSPIFESEAKRAGRAGERFATQKIQEILKDDDILFTNVNVSFDGKDAELDNVIINKHGVFIIEVKNYKGNLYGNEDDYEWVQEKVSHGGYLYDNTHRNPIGQVKREIYILANYLKQNGIKVWVEGYVYFVRGNSPVESDYIVNGLRDIHNVIHFGTDNNLSKRTVSRLADLLSRL